MSDNNGKGKGLAIGAVVGAVAGVVTGILFAPKSGKETREDIKETAEKTKARVIKEANKAQDELGVAIEKVEKIAREKGALVNVKAKEALKVANDAKETLVTKVKDVTDNSDSETTEKELKVALKKAADAQKALEKLLNSKSEKK